MMRGLTNTWQTQANYLVAIQYGDVDRCAALLAAGADADQTFKINSVTRPALCLGVERGAYALVELLIRSGVAVNRRDSKGYTSLHDAVEMGYESIVELLLQNRADVDAADDHLITPLHIASKRGALRIVSSLIAHNCDVNRTDNNGKSALSYVCGVPNSNKEIIKMLLDNGASPDDLDATGHTPLMCLLSNSSFNFDTVKLLVECGAKLDIVTKEGNAPIHKIILSTNPEKWKCLKLLLKSACDMNICNQMGQSPIHLACLMSDIESLRILIRANANPNTLDRLGISPLAYCISNGFSSFAHLLIDGGANEDLNQLSLHPLRGSFRNELLMRLSNPPSLKAIARHCLKSYLEPHYEEWVIQNEPELPKTMNSFVMYNEPE